MNKTSVEKAYEYAMKIVNEIESHEIQIKKIIPRVVRENSKNLPKLTEKYSPPDRLPVELWRHIEMHPKSDEDWNYIFEKAKELHEFGISFDSGAGCGVRDWEFDWSFRYDSNNTDTERLEGLEDLIINNGLNKKIIN